MASSASLQLHNRQPLNSRRGRSRHVILADINMNRRTRMANPNKTSDRVANNGSADMERVWKDLRTVANIEKWDKILKERFFELTRASPRLPLFSKLSDTNRVKMAHFMKVAMETAVSHGKLYDVRSLFRLAEKYRTPLDDGGSVGVAYMAGLMAAAVIDGRVDIVKELIKNGGDPNQVHKERSHLSRAIPSGACHLIVSLIQQGADPNQTTPTGKSVLHEAASTSSADVINCLIDNGACSEIRDKIQGNTPLHTACSYANRDAIFAIYDRGTEFNAVNNIGDTPLAKLIRPLTKADNFHNKTRMELAKDIVKLGFTLAPKPIKPHNKVHPKHNLVSSVDTKAKPQCLLTKPQCLLTKPQCLLTKPQCLLTKPQCLLTKSLSASHLLSSSASSSPPSSSSPSSFLSRSTTKYTARTLSTSPSSSTPLSEIHQQFEELSRLITQATDNEFTGSFRYRQHDDTDNHQSPTSVLHQSPSSSSSTSSLHSQQQSSSDDDNDNIHQPWPQKRTKDDRIRDLYHRLALSEHRELNLQQRCRLSILHSLGTRPLASSLCTLGLPALVIRYLRHGGREG